VAEAIVIGGAETRFESPAAQAFWRGDVRGMGPQPRALLRLVRVATKREVLRREWLSADPVLRDLRNLKMAAGTNYRVSPEQAARLSTLWGRTGRDWSRDEAVAGLWAYAKTYGAEVSRLEGSPVADVSMLIGRAIAGVYNKVMNFRALDPREQRTGLSGASDTDRTVWGEFYDVEVRQLRLVELEHEFGRLWRSPPNFAYSESPEARRESVAAVARQFEAEGLEALLRRYRNSIATRSALPPVTSSEARSYLRDALVVAIARVRANYRCEVPHCGHSPFVAEDGYPYCEVHHIKPLSEGGEDTIENVACLCASHHREVHHGSERAPLLRALRELRTPSDNPAISSDNLGTS
jgi:hypothetical protein